jgi:hypothetical protein
LPHYVSPKPGIVYEYGGAYRFDKELFWISMYLVIDPSTGIISVCDERQFHREHIQVRDPATRRAVGNEISFTTYGWTKPDLISDRSKTESDRSDLERFEMTVFAQLFDWWASREERWNVAVMKNGERVTFSIDHKLSKNYFADRDKTAKAADGTAKKIIHHVREHIRIVNGKEVVIKEHVRGMSDFHWNGYHCVVTAPKLMGDVITASFSLPSADEEEPDSSNLIPLSKLGSVLARIEDMDHRKMKPSMNNSFH